MLTTHHEAIARLPPIDLEELDRVARLRTRKDRKYIVSEDTFADLVTSIDADVRALEISGRRWFGYRSVYFDTPRRDAYRLAATRRPERFKVRRRTYLDSGITMAEVKTKSRRGQTVKARLELDVENDGDVRSFARTFEPVAPYADDLQPTLISEYRRATLVFPADGVRVTVDRAFRCGDRAGARADLRGGLIVETKTSGPPSAVDRHLWAMGHRPVKISKFATGLAAMDPTLPANRWHRVLSEHFDQRSGRPTEAPCWTSLEEVVA